MLPQATHLQFLVLGTLLGGDKSGRELRSLLQAEGVRKTLAAFYQLMARLEDAQFVEGRYELETVDGQSLRERFYKITGRGIEAWETTRDFYIARAGLGLQGI